MNKLVVSHFAASPTQVPVSRIIGGHIMPDIKSLANRIDAEFSGVEAKVKTFQAEQVEEHKQWQKRLEELGNGFNELRDIWRPRLELKFSATTACGSSSCARINSNSDLPPGTRKNP
jgi:hypothetical protein